MTTLLIKKLGELKAALKEVEYKLNNFELDPDNYADQFDDMLDEVEGQFMGYCASDILKRLDPTAYRCGLLDYLDGLERECDEDYIELQNEYNYLLEDISDLENELNDTE